MNMRIIDESQIINGGENLEGVLSKWTIDFYNKFKSFFINYENAPDIGDENLEAQMNNDIINKPRFFEMRPKIFQ